MFKILILSFLGLFTNNQESNVDVMHEECIALLDTDISGARAKAEGAYKISKNIEYPWGMAHSLFIMAYCDKKLDHFNKAVPEYLQALDLYSKIDTERSKINQAKVYNNLGKIFKAHYKYDDAINFYELSFEIASDYNEIGLMRRVLHNKAITYRHKGDLVKAAETQFQRLGLVEEGNASKAIVSYNQLGLIHTDLGNYEEARDYFGHILKLEQDKKLSKHRAKAYHNIAMTFSKEGNLSETENMLLKALEEKTSLNNTRDLFVTYLDLTDLYMQLDDISKAEKFALSAHSINKDLPVSIDNNKINHYLSQIYFSADQPEKAKIYFDKYVNQMESLYAQQKELASQGDQYKIELITSTYFAKIQEKEKFNYYMFGVAGLVAFFILFLVYSRYKRVAAAKLLREHFSSISFNISNTTSSK